MGKPFFITTAIDYTNGAPHIGHAYEKVLADVLARYHRLKGDDVFYLTGVDQHGQKVQQSADKAGVPPQEFVDGITAKFKALWEKLDVRYDRWAATTDPLHKECVRNILQQLWDDKDPATGNSRWIYKKSQRGFYSVRQEQFLTDKERGPDGQFGPEWGQVEERDEENYYFRLTAHPSLPLDEKTGQPLDPKQWLTDLIDARTAAGTPLVVPDFRVSELRNAVAKLEGDLCISRPKARLAWGIEFPFAPEFVTYVWFDALVNYISFAGYRQEKADGQLMPSFPGAPASGCEWPALHVIGKDILIPAHGVYWPIMLKALGFADDDMPTLLVHGWWNIAGAKMSKSLGNIVDPDLLADKYGPEALRYYLMSDIATGEDADFSEERLIIRYNADLANTFGNLLNRTLSMTAKYRSSVLRRCWRKPSQVVKAIFSLSPGDLGRREPLDFEDHIPRYILRDYLAWMDASKVSYGLQSPDQLAMACNSLVEIAKPWVLAKEEKTDPAKTRELDEVLYTLAESLRIIAILISPVLPKAAHEILDQINWKMDETGKESRLLLADVEWGGLPDGHRMGQPIPIFPRINTTTE